MARVQSFNRPPPQFAGVYHARAWNLSAGQASSIWSSLPAASQAEQEGVLIRMARPNSNVNQPAHNTTQETIPGPTATIAPGTVNQALQLPSNPTGALSRETMGADPMGPPFLAPRQTLASSVT